MKQESDKQPNIDSGSNSDSVSRSTTIKSYLSVSGYAKRLRIRPETIREWIKSGELKAINVASADSIRPKWRISQEAIDDFEARRSSVTESDSDKEEVTLASGRRIACREVI